MLLLAATGGVHAALAPMHADEGAAIQVLFVLSAVATWVGLAQPRTGDAR